jgi:hypothetical protein
MSGQFGLTVNSAQRIGWLVGLELRPAKRKAR